MDCKCECKQKIIDAYVQRALKTSYYDNAIGYLKNASEVLNQDCKKCKCKKGKK